MCKNIFKISKKRVFKTAITSVILTLIAFSLFSFTAFAHSGRTDSQGGHYDWSTGEYHYHHGYPAHKHPNGECPHKFDDKTAEQSTTSSVQKNNISNGNNKKETSPIINFIMSGMIAFFAIPFLPYIEYIFFMVLKIKPINKEVSYFWYWISGTFIIYGLLPFQKNEEPYFYITIGVIIFLGIILSHIGNDNISVN